MDNLMIMISCSSIWLFWCKMLQPFLTSTKLLKLSTLKAEFHLAKISYRPSFIIPIVKRHVKSLVMSITKAIYHKLSRSLNKAVP